MVGCSDGLVNHGSSVNLILPREENLEEMRTNKGCFRRTGGNVQDLFARTFCAILGAVWGGLSYAAGSGNPYVIAVFAIIFVSLSRSIISPSVPEPMKARARRARR